MKIYVLFFVLIILMRRSCNLTKQAVPLTVHKPGLVIAELRVIAIVLWGDEMRRVLYFQIFLKPFFFVSLQQTNRHCLLNPPVGVVPQVLDDEYESFILLSFTDHHSVTSEQLLYRGYCMSPC